MMGRKIIDLTGRVFGGLIVLKITPIKKWGLHWKCLCSCGVIKIINGHNLKRGNTKSCGCNGKYQTHGKTGTKEYNIWKAMKQRCYNKKNRAYQNYGGRGITMSPRWVNSFTDFLIDMGYCPPDKHSIDRIDNDGNYELSNCRWATMAEQGVNRRSTRVILYCGVKKPLSIWCRELNLNYHKTVARIVHLKWPTEKAFEL